MEDLIQVRLHRQIEIIDQLGKYSIGTHGLRKTDLRIMSLLYDAGALSINELARCAHVDKAWISRSVMQLMAKRWLRKDANPQDMRSQLISLTTKSRGLLDTVRPIVQRNEQLLLAGINEKQLKKQLDRMIANSELLLASHSSNHQKKP